MAILDALRSSLRQFRHHPLYACACAGTLALAVAAATASLAVVRRAFFDPLPYAHGDRVASLLTMVEGRTSPVSVHVLTDLQAGASPFDAFASVRPTTSAYSGGETAERIPGNLVTTSYFDTLGVHPAIGGAWSDGDRDAIVLSWSFWQRALAGDPGIVGRRIVVLDDAVRTVAGVMPQGFVAPYWPRTDFWTPLDTSALLSEPRGRRQLTVFARRATAASQQDVHAYLAVFSGQQQEKFRELQGRQSWVAIPLGDELVGNARPALLGTGGAAALLLLIVFANIAGLSTARAVGMRQQCAVRTALGASRARLFRERLIDGLVVATVGSAAGVWLGDVVITIAARYQQQFLDRLAPIALDGTTAGLGFGIGLLTGVMAAVGPQSVISASRPADSLRASRGGAGDVRLTVTRSALVVVQVALALVLIVGAGLLVRTVSHLASTSLGFESERLTTFNVNFPVPRYGTAERQIQVERDVLQQLARVPGVTSATASVGFPIVGGMRAALRIFGREAEGLAEIPYFSVTPNFMPSIGVQLKGGRGLEETDHAASPRVVIINETMARMFWPKGDAIGARVQIGPGSPNQAWITIVGIVSDVRQHGPATEIQPTAFGSTRQYSWPYRYFTVRMAQASESLGADVRAAVRAVDPTLATGAITPVDQLVSDQTARHRLVMLALTFFGLVATVLCGFGLYAVVSLTSQLRRREYAIRIALGAPCGGVRWMVLRQAIGLAVGGAMAGVALAAGGTRTLHGLLHGVAPLDTVTFTVAALAVLLLAGMSAWWPAHQAGRVDPVEALKAD